LLTLDTIRPLHRLPGLPKGAILLESWTLFPGHKQVQLYQQEEQLWIYCETMGAVSFSRSHQEFTLYKTPEIPAHTFRHTFLRYWLPLLYNGWGHLVLHASAIWHTESQRAILFVGNSNTGKSTWAYGLGQRKGWAQLTDDAFAMSFPQGKMKVVPLPGIPRLRPQSKAHFEAHDAEQTPCPWPNTPVQLTSVYFLLPQPSLPTSLQLEPMASVNTFPQYIGQAFVLHLDWPSLHQTLIHNTLLLAAQVPTFQLLYRPSFARFDQAIEQLANHALRDWG